MTAADDRSVRGERELLTGSVELTMMCRLDAPAEPAAAGEQREDAII